MMPLDLIQLIVTGIVGLFITWGIFLAFIGFRTVKPGSKNRRTAVVSAVLTAIIGVGWIMIWVSIVVINALQLVGFIPPST